jgi:twitching motility protein PilT
VTLRGDIAVMFNFVTEILSFAKSNNATDIHLAAGSVPRIRIDGKLAATPFRKICPEDTAVIIDNVLNDQQKATLNEKHYYSLPVTMDNVGRIRFNAFMQRGSYSINLRLLDRKLPSVEKLGIPDTIINLTKLKSGLVLFCGQKRWRLTNGPANSGKP